MYRQISRILLCILVLVSTLNIAEAGGIRKRKIRRLFKHSAIFNDHFTGFALYDLDENKSLLEINADKYYTPASNTKLFTFYTSLKILGDSIPALKYQLMGDSLLFWGTGDPSFLHPDLKGTKALHFLQQSGKQLYFCNGLYQNEILGSGWAWDDYNDYYQAEINELPLYGNLVEIRKGNGKLIQSAPDFFAHLLKADSSLRTNSFTVRRNLTDNTLMYPVSASPTENYHQYVPFQTSTALTIALLQDTLKLNVCSLHLPLPADAHTIYDLNADTVYRHMLQPSDNFIAEQLLLSCSSVKFGYLNSDSVRNYSLSHFLNDLPDKPEWHDGSGLSRLNLFTPRDLIALLLKIRAEINNDERLFSLLPAGGVSGTLKRVYQTDNGKPFVFAKTGSLSNNYNQSGYLITRKGKHLAFSLMNNNFVEPSRTVRDEIVKLMTYIHDNF
ncbi:D-alanyl-D-alanine carboxypeptidase [Mucilaginibacter sp. RS28]|uniref:D-alanyl-D-alanine carboxypeptidase n=1 Tax=Mucilaginibacter straminoryzae TaxID=2932774 RepID=A0A9X2BDZ1_9SPHI|nr:D-alanyl-D-alanine carboxypeptidase [Mucilaginibacter straminoryzae]MCJ8210858.1 D-alanyl-D-alanine carboxypeptidase [Mucilaginibacter straminoryzae]